MLIVREISISLFSNSFLLPKKSKIDIKWNIDRMEYWNGG
jgi:hypothetical protein